MNKEKNSGGRIRKPQHGRRLRWGKQFILLAAIAVLALGIVGGTSAYLLTSYGPVTNTFTPSHVTCAVIEDPFTQKVSTEKTNVRIQNTGDTEAYIRAAIIVTWQDSSGNVSATVPVAGTDYVITFPTNSNWKTDGRYYYYNGSVTPGGITSNLIESCTVRTTNGNYTLHVEILADAIQSSPVDAIKQAWGIGAATLVGAISE